MLKSWVRDYYPGLMSVVEVEMGWGVGERRAGLLGQSRGNNST